MSVARSGRGVLGRWPCWLFRELWLKDLHAMIIFADDSNGLIELSNLSRRWFALISPLCPFAAIIDLGEEDYVSVVDSLFAEPLLNFGVCGVTFGNRRAPASTRHQLIFMV